MVVQKKKDNLPPNGLKNKGNTCFFNAAMQCILSIGELNTFYKNTDFPREKMVSNALKQFIMEYESPGCHDPKNLIDRLSIKIKLFNGMQQDSHEFLIQFIDLLYNEFDNNGSKFESREEFEMVRKHNLVAKMMFSMDKQTLVCGACNYTSATTALNSTILVEPHSTLQLGIDHCYEEVRLEGKDAWRCDKCGERRSSRKRIEVLAHPEILIVHISRFHPQGWKNVASVEINDTLKFNDRKYDLFGIVCQNGTLNGGHYVAEAKRSGTWNLYDDEHVTRSFKTYSGSHPYLAFYTLG